MVALLRRAAALGAELGERTVAPVDLTLADDPVAASYQAVALAPLGPADRQELLAAPSPAARTQRLREALPPAIAMLEALLSGG